MTQWTIRTGLLLVEGHLVPVNLHTVAEVHPQLGLLLRGHSLPALLNTGEGGVRDGMVGGKTSLQGVHGGRASAEDGRGARHSASDGAKKHCAAGGRWYHHVEIESIGYKNGMTGASKVWDHGRTRSGGGESGGGGDGERGESCGLRWKVEDPD